VAGFFPWENQCHTGVAISHTATHFSHGKKRRQTIIKFHIWSSFSPHKKKNKKQPKQIIFFSFLFFFFFSFFLIHLFSSQKIQVSLFDNFSPPKNLTFQFYF